MPYTPNVPQANQRINDTQTPILNNFQAIQTLINVNHVEFDDPDQGKHKWVTFPEQVAAPSTAANEVALYSQESALTGVAELFLRKESDGTEIEFSSAVAATPGWSRLPSGVLLKWGSITDTGNFTVTFPVAANTPVFSNIFVVLVSTSAPANAPVTAPDRYVQVYEYGTAMADLPNPPINGFRGFATTMALVNAQVTFTYLAIGN